MAFLFTRYHNNVKRRADQSYAAVAATNAALALAKNRAFGPATVGTATVTSQVRTGATVAYTAGGVWLSKGSTDNFWTLAGAAIPPSSFGGYVFLIDSAGAAVSYAMTPSKISQAASTFAGLNGTSPWGPLLQMLNGGTGSTGNSAAIVGYATIATNASTTFTPGTTLLGAAGVTTTYFQGIPEALVHNIAGPNGGIYGLVY